MPKTKDVSPAPELRNRLVKKLSESCETIRMTVGEARELADELVGPVILDWMRQKFAAAYLRMDDVEVNEGQISPVEVLQDLAKELGVQWQLPAASGGSFDIPPPESGMRIDDPTLTMDISILSTGVLKRMEYDLGEALNACLKAGKAPGYLVTRHEEILRELTRRNAL